MNNLIEQIDTTVAHLFAQIKMVEEQMMNEKGLFVSMEAAMYHSACERPISELLKIRSNIIMKANKPTGVEAIQAFIHGNTISFDKDTARPDIKDPERYFTMDLPISRTAGSILDEPSKPKRKYTRRAPAKKAVKKIKGGKK